jgi:hypothetical protein
LLKLKILICFGLLIHVQTIMDKSRMSARKGTTQYNDKCRAFVEFPVSNCTAANGKIYCTCKYCRNNQRHSTYYVFAHLTGGMRMSPGYILWYMHSETEISGPVPGRYSNPVATDATAGSTEQGGGTKQGRGTELSGDMHAMLRGYRDTCFPFDVNYFLPIF